MYFLGWLVVNDYLICVLGFSISGISFFAILHAIAEDTKKRPAYWDRLIKRSLPYLLVAGLVLSFLGYFLTFYVHISRVFLWLLGVNALVFAVIGFLFYYIREYIKRRRKKKKINYKRF